MSQAEKRQRWSEWMTMWREGDLTIAAFCRRHGVSVAQFYYWRAKLAQPDARESARQLVPAVFQPPAPNTHLVLRLTNGVTIEGLDDRALAQLLPQVAAL